MANPLISIPGIGMINLSLIAIISEIRTQDENELDEEDQDYDEDGGIYYVFTVSCGNITHTVRKYANGKKSEVKALEKVTAIREDLIKKYAKWHHDSTSR